MYSLTLRIVSCGIWIGQSLGLAALSEARATSPFLGSDPIAFTVVPRIARARSTKFTGGACRPAHA
jgi:hypothetical protein